ncbi:HAMP domain-containing histidine kinase [bacterium]|nr:HAMP domain-containing histidine kinase [bacterium]
MQREKIKYSFRKKLFWYIAVLVLLVSLTFAGLFIQQQNKLLKENLVNKGLSLVTNLARMSELAIFSEEDSFIDPVINGIWAEKDVVYVFLYKDKGKILVKHTRMRTTEKLNIDVKQKIHNTREPFWQYPFSSSKVWEFYAPVFATIERSVEDSLLNGKEKRGKVKGRIIGISRVGISLININEQQKKIIKLSIKITLTLLIIAFLVTYLIAKKITTPILELAERAEILGRGNFDKEIKIKSSDEIGLLAKEFDSMRLKLRKLNKMKDDFVSLVSHELRTPLTSIKGYTSILLSCNLGELNDQQKEKMERIAKHVKRLTSLITGLLDLSKIRYGKIDYEGKFISLLELVKNIVEELDIQAKDKDINLEIEISSGLPDVYVDEKLLSRVFINLIGNAIKFTPQGGKITIRAVNEADMVKVYCIDTGIGISPADSNKIFSEFYRIKNKDITKTEGTGLGLAIVKHIIEINQGKIWVESEESKGSRFIFTLPINKR